MAVIYVGTRAFPISPNPQAGDHYLGLDTANSNRLTRQDSAGVVKDLESGLSYTDADAVDAINTEITTVASKAAPASADYVYLRSIADSAFRRATKASLQQPDVQRYWTVSTDFISTVTGDFTGFIAGSGASSQTATYGQDLTENAVGVTESDTGTTSTGRAGIGLISGVLLRPTWGRLRYQGRHAVNNLSSVAETYVLRIGLTDSYITSGDGTNGLYFRYTDLINGGRWQAVSRAGGVDLIAVDTGVSPGLDYAVFEVELNSDNTAATFRIDGAVVATINAPNLPAPSNAFGAGFKIEKTVGATQRNLYSDFISVEMERTTAR